MLKAKLIVDSRRPTKNGFPIKIEIYQGRKYKYIGINKYQNSKTLKITAEIARRISSLEDEVNFCNQYNLSLDESVSIIKNGVHDKELEIFLLKKKLAELQSKSGIGIIEFMEIRIQELKDLKRSIEAYERTKKQVSYFLKPDADVLINDIDYEWLQSFIRYKVKFGKGKGNVTFLLKTLRAVYKEAQRRESLNIKRDNPFLGLIRNDRTREVPKFTNNDIKKLFEFKPNISTTKKSKFVINRHIKLFLFQIQIGGQDYADLASLKWTDIKDGRISFRRYKNINKPNGGPLVDNKLFPYALSVIEEFGTKNNKRIFGHIPHPKDSNYRTKRQNANQSLARISKTLELSENLKTKTPRYLFRSFAGELAIDTLTIMQIQGHKPEGTTFKYQKPLSYSVVDEAHQKILDFIFLNSELKD